MSEHDGPDAVESESTDADAADSRPAGADSVEGTDADGETEQAADAAGTESVAADADGTDSEVSDPADAESAAAGDAAYEAATSTEDLDVEAMHERAAELDEGLADDVERLVSHLRRLHGKVSDLSAELDERDEQVADLQERLKRKQADFQNYKKRAKKRQDQIRDRATEDLVERVVGVRDNLVRALDQPEDANIRDGVESTLKELDRVLEEENVSPIEPDVGSEVDPQRHEVMMRVDSDQPEDTIADVYKPGYEMAGKVIEAAQITVSNGSEADEDAGTDE